METAVHIGPALLGTTRLETAGAIRPRPTPALRLAGRLIQAATPAEALHAFTDQMRQTPGVVLVAVGSQRAGSCRLVRLSTAAEAGPELEQAADAALADAALRQTVVQQSAADEQPVSQCQAALLALLQAECSLAARVELSADAGQKAASPPVGALVVVAESREAAEQAWALYAAVAPLLGAWLQRSSAAGGSLIRCAQRMEHWLDRLRHRGARWALVAVATLLLFPVPRRVDCRCTLEPSQRRFVAAPFDAALAESLVRPGDLVEKDQVLLTLDGRELVSQLAAAETRWEQAERRRETALARNQVSAAQVAALDSDLAREELAVLARRQEQLQIRSPLAGVVVSGDLERVAGAPVKLGDKLFEIAPLDQMLAEVFIAADDIADVSTGYDVSLTLDSYPTDAIVGQIARIHPRGEIREDRYGYVAEFTLTEESAGLRPGMTGWAAVEGHRVPWIWNWLRKPARTLWRWLRGAV